jgi:fermentation-respiration switch protein FrsA (DUF1100 family)
VAYHDRDADGRLDTLPIGLPLEPYAISRDAPARFGPPAWRAAAFHLVPGVNHQWGQAALKSRPHAGVRPRPRSKLTAVLLAVGVFAVATYVGLVAVLLTLERRFVYYPDPLVQQPHDPAIQVVQIVAEDGERLVGWYRPPAPGRPVMLFFDGNGGRLHQQRSRWTAIAAHGAGQLSIAYRGYSGSTGKPTEARLHSDARAAYAWLTARHAASDIVIHGFSLGSGVAVRLAAERPCRALVLEAPYSAVVDVAAERLPLVSCGHADARALRVARAHRPGERAVLMVHGTRDRVIPLHSGERLFAAAKEPKTFVAAPGAEHHGLVQAGLYPTIWSFLPGLSPP